jgi:hypothetical protein
MKITPNRFVGVLVSLLAASTLLSLTGVLTGNPSLYYAGFALLISVVPVVVLQSWFSGRADDNSQEQ